MKWAHDAQKLRFRKASADASHSRGDIKPAEERDDAAILIRPPDGHHASSPRARHCCHQSAAAFLRCRRADKHDGAGTAKQLMICARARVADRAAVTGAAPPGCTCQQKDGVDGLPQDADDAPMISGSLRRERKECHISQQQQRRL